MIQTPIPSTPVDYFRIVKNGDTLKGASVANTKSAKGVAHWDAVQLIPNSFNEVESPLSWRSHYALAQLVDATVENCVIVDHSGEDSLQGITCFDGLLRNVRIINNVIGVRSAHEITLHGVLSGVVAYNRVRPLTLTGGSRLTVRLNPARIGGAPTGVLLSEPYTHTPMHILSWKKGEGQPDYTPLQSGGDSKYQQVIDRRRCFDASPYARHLFNFDYLAWEEHMQMTLPEVSAYYADDVMGFCGWVQQEATRFGDLILGDELWTNETEVAQF